MRLQSTCAVMALLSSLACVVAVNMETGTRVETSTATTGGYTMRVPPGAYRLELEVRAGEALVISPDPTEVDAGDLDAGRNFVVARRG